MTKGDLKSRLRPYENQYDIYYDEASENSRYVLVRIASKGLDPNDWIGGPICIDKITGEISMPGTVLSWFEKVEAKYGEFEEVEV